MSIAYHTLTDAELMEMVCAGSEGAKKELSDRLLESSATSKHPTFSAGDAVHNQEVWRASRRGHDTLDGYQVAAARTCNADLSTTDGLAMGALGLTGEAGEVADLVKKVIYHGHLLDDEMRARLVSELGDVLWYVAHVALMLDVRLSEVASVNVEKLHKRYPEGFDPERSINREEEK